MATILLVIVLVAWAYVEGRKLPEYLETRRVWRTLAEANGKVAMISVFHKEGIAQFAQDLVKMNWLILASGGTAKHLNEAGIPVFDVGRLVGPPILGHRVVTLAREIYAGILANKKVQSDLEELRKKLLAVIGLVCVDMYPLSEEIVREGATEESVIEKTDIGGPTLLRAAAKARRIVICDPDDRYWVAGWIRNGCPDEEKILRDLAAKAEFTVGKYCMYSALYHGGLKYVGKLAEMVAELSRVTYAITDRKG